MLTKKLLTYFFPIIFTSLPSIVYAYQGEPVNYQGVTFIEHPETVQTYFGELAGKSNILYFKQDQNFTLTIKVLTPVSDPEKDIHVRIGYLSQGNSIGQNLVQLYGSNDDWAKYLATINGQEYLQLPEYKYLAGSGEYTIEISSPDNYGEYALIIGHKQETSPNESSFYSQFNFVKKILIVLFTPLMVLIIISVIVLRVIQTAIPRKSPKRKSTKSKRNKPGS